MSKGAGRPKEPDHVQVTVKLHKETLETLRKLAGGKHYGYVIDVLVKEYESKRTNS